ncbi:MAG: ABC transporter permease, partial [Chloroflexi bacterium]|nr:ABC transporter permease [Chloroflexota bacterium]
MWRETWRRLVRRPASMVGLVIVSVFVAMAVLADLISPHDPLTGNLALRLQLP